MTVDQKRTEADAVITVTQLEKSFRLPHEKHSGIKQLIINTLRGRKNKGYETQQVLKGISFEIKKGDFYGIVGRNGSGKSTLLKLLAGIYSPDKGAIATSGSIVPFIELGVGFNPELTGRENIFLNGALLGFSRMEIRDMYDEIVAFAELEKFMDQKLKNYSSGMQVRLAFSIAIQARGDILILDEVLAVGDEAFQKKCNDFFNEIKRNKTKTVVLVTHGMDAVRRYCNKALLLDKGEVRVIGDPNEVADAYSTQFIPKSEIAVREKNRYGTGEVTYANIGRTIAGDGVTLTFDITNNTDADIADITMGYDFCINGDIIIGNDTRYLDGYKQGISLAARSTKHFSVRFTNNFGNYTFTVNMNITTGLGMTVTDHIRGALEFKSTNIRFSDAFKVLSFPEITETE